MRAAKTPEEALAHWLGDFDWNPGLPPVGVAVSGGGDSVALLHLVTERVGARAVRAVTVDHGLRDGSAAEARFVAELCASLGVAHDVLRWSDRGGGNLQERARLARRRLIGAWARGYGVRTVHLAHTSDDQAENVLLRLARGSGVDGLAAMRGMFGDEGVLWLRPLLGVSREDLRRWLRARGLAWVEDPSNEDPRFDRARARAMMGHLAGLGLTRDRLVQTAEHMARARGTLVESAVLLAEEIAREDGADLLLRDGFLFHYDQTDTPCRLLALAIMWVGGGSRRPRWRALERVALMVHRHEAATLGGCRLSFEDGWVRIAREARNPGPAPAERFADFVARQASPPSLAPNTPG